uniref:ERCC1-like central domain-containing protein n=1 Tax=Clastoptera arizonana TaxID=38151 RepID=A0A1B6C8P4_9HEMI
MASFTTAFVNLKESENYGCVQSEVIKYLNDPIQDISAQTTTDVIKVSGSIGNSILVNPKQKGNPLLTYISNVPWEFDDSIIPDYVMGRTTCALFLSLRFHNLKPEYINERLRDLGRLYDLRVLVVQVIFFR